MSVGTNLIRAYFDYAYNPVYDFTTARLNRYRKLQEECVGKLELKDKDRVLCVGIGTGNEISHIFDINKNLSIVGIDYSRTALQKAYKKALALGKEIEVLIMDARRLEFAAESFDKVLCVHVMDFMEDDKQATVEILRVLKDGGQYVITYPSAREGVQLGLNLFKDNIRNINPEKSRVKVLLECLAEVLVGIIYVPFLLRRERRSYSRSELEAILSQLIVGDFEIEEDAIYQDLIVYGTK